MDIKNNRKVWIDLENSPHIPFFKPIINELERKGYDVFITARDCFQVCELADLFKLQYKKIGRHYGKNKTLKVFGLIWRTFQLLPSIIKEKPDIAVSHFSRSQMLLSWLKKIPFAVIIDYEHTQWLPFVHPTCVIIPEAIPDGVIKEQVLKYPGIKEDVYAVDFKPNPSVLDTLGLNEKDLIITIRPPAEEAHYHNPESELLYRAVIDHILTNFDARTVILPRNKEKQTAFIEATWPAALNSKRLIIPDGPVNGMDLIWFSDLVVSGGGTMNREATALGVPVFSIFRGKIGAVDKYLCNIGLLTLLENVGDIEKKLVIVSRNKSAEYQQGNKAALDTILSHLLEMSNNRSSHLAR